MTRRYEQYRDSGVEWLGEIPAHWETMRGNYVFRVINERSRSGEETLLSVSEHHGVKPRSESNVNMFMAESYAGHKTCIPGDLVINSLWAWSRGLGFSNYHGIVSTAYSVFRPDHKKYDYKFLNYLLRIEQYVAQYLIASKGIWISRLQLSDWSFLRLPILLPPKEEQTAIAAFLDEKTAQIEEAIALKERQIALLKERKQILIQTAVTRGLNPHAPLRDSGIDWIGPIPAHWERKRLKYLLSEINKRSESGDEELLSLSKYHGVIRKSQLEERAGQAASLIGYKKVHNDQLVINKMQAVNGLLAVSKTSGITSPDYSVYQVVDSAILNVDYLGYLLVQDVYLAEFKKRVTGVMEGFIRLYTDDLYAIYIHLPPAEEQTAIVAHIETESAKIDEAIDLQKQMIERLKEYKTTLINSAVTGKIKVA